MRYYNKIFIIGGGFMKIGKKLFLVRLVFIVVIGLIVAASASQFGKIRENFTDIRTTTLEDIYVVSEIKEKILNQQLYVSNYVFQNSTTSYNTFVTEQQLIEELMEQLKKSDVAEAQDLITMIDQSRTKFDTAVENIVKLNEQGEKQQVQTLLDSEIETISTQLNEQASELLALYKETFNTVALDNEGLIQSTIITFVIFFIISLVINGFVGRYIKKSIVKPLVQVEQSIHAIATGDLTGERIDLNTKDEIASLANSFNELHTSIKKLIFAAQDQAHGFSVISTQLSSNVNTVLSASEDIANNAENISNGTQQAAQIASDTSNAMEETANAVSNIAESTAGVHEKAVNTNIIAQKGDATIYSVNVQMDEIYNSTKLMVELITSLSKSSEEIRQMTQVITDITEQTNLLSLNAAIEAARAGEHGKGFAVVADEVGKLADQSKQSATVIEQLTNSILNETKHVQVAVSSSLQQVEIGVEKIEEAGLAFSQITSAVGEIVDSVAEVSAVTEQISATTEQVNAAVNELSQTVSSTANATDQISKQIDEQFASVEDVSTVTKSINDKVEALTILVEKYKL